MPELCGHNSLCIIVQHSYIVHSTLSLHHSQLVFRCKIVWFVTYIGLFYYILGNLEPRLRSPINSIQLVAVVKTSVIDTYGIDKVLEPFVQDVMKLESVSPFFASASNYRISFPVIP